MTTAVLDASAVIAWLVGENGADVVRDAVADVAALSTVNLAEILAKIGDRGGDVGEVHSQLVDVLDVTPFDEEQAGESAIVRSITRSYDVSLGDRACLALGRVFDLPVLTADCRWTKIPGLGVTLRCIR
jgi:PIN domain nuclease of toxin-antitoxin system